MFLDIAAIIAPVDLDAHIVVAPGISSIAKTILATGGGPVLLVPIRLFVIDVLAEI